MNYLDDAAIVLGCSICVVANTPNFSLETPGRNADDSTSDEAFYLASVDSTTSSMSLREVRLHCPYSGLALVNHRPAQYQGFDDVQVIHLIRETQQERHDPVIVVVREDGQISSCGIYGEVSAHMPPTNHSGEDSLQRTSVQAAQIRDLRAEWARMMSVTQGSSSGQGTSVVDSQQGSSSLENTTSTVGTAPLPFTDLNQAFLNGPWGDVVQALNARLDGRLLAPWPVWGDGWGYLYGPLVSAGILPTMKAGMNGNYLETAKTFMAALVSLRLLHVEPLRAYCLRTM